jgi:hypothetical protein
MTAKKTTAVKPIVFSGLGGLAKKAERKVYGFPYAIRDVRF